MIVFPKSVGCFLTNLASLNKPQNALELENTLNYMIMKNAIKHFRLATLALLSCSTLANAQSDLSSYFNNVTLTKGYKNQSDHNPLFTQRFGADPCAMVYNDEVYIYMTNDVLEYKNGALIENTYSQINTINCVSSKDMVNWTDHGTMKVAGRRQGLGPANWASCSWAPTACHAVINGKEKFFLYFANNGSGVGVVTSDCPWGPWTDPIGKELISRNTPTCSDVTWLFDPAVLVDDDGTGYLYFGGGVPSGKNADPGTARVAKLGKDFISVSGSPSRINPPYLFEDAGINKIGNKYIYSYCSNWNCPGNPMSNAEICYMTSSNPMGPFTYTGVAYANQGAFLSGQNGGNNHHSMFEFKGKWYMTYHARLLQNAMNICPNQNLNYRSTHVDYVNVNTSNGTITKSKGSVAGVSQVGSLNPFEKTEAETMAWMGGIDTEYGGSNMLVTKIDKGDWIGVAGVDFGTGASVFSARVSSKSKQAIKICLDKVNGPVAGYIEVPNTNGQLTDITTRLTPISGKHDLFFIFSGEMQFDFWQFKQADVTLEISDENLEAPANVSLNVKTTESKLASAEFFLDGESIGTTNAAPFSISVTNLEPGTYSFSAKVKDQSGNVYETNSCPLVVRIAQAPFNGVPFDIPGKVEAEEFDFGGEGYAYHDNDEQNRNGDTRNEGVDMNATAIGYCEKGEWLEYTVNIKEADTYVVKAYVAGDNGTGAFQLYLDDNKIGSEFVSNNTGSFSAFEPVTQKIEIKDLGKHILKLEITSSWLDIDYIEFVSSSTGVDANSADQLKVVETHYMNFGGHVVSDEAKGALIKQEIFENGSMKFTKVVK